jgi:hypothetical protein
MKVRFSASAGGIPVFDCQCSMQRALRFLRAVGLAGPGEAPRDMRPWDPGYELFSSSGEKAMGVRWHFVIKPVGVYPGEKP